MTKVNQGVLIWMTNDELVLFKILSFSDLFLGNASTWNICGSWVMELLNIFTVNNSFFTHNQNSNKTKILLSLSISLSNWARQHEIYFWEILVFNETKRKTVNMTNWNRRTYSISLKSYYNQFQLNGFMKVRLKIELLPMQKVLS